MKKSKQAHTPASPKGMGDYYGTGIKNPVSGVKKIKTAVPKIKSKKINFA